ncbi:ABC transporter substrate-binding protein [Nocardioides mangrovi]|uniref:ABC transporter substrate-binding protein n=1 Tax=Nocardioides mangrovi TaxID=2874580 RepID=A0ABS7UFE7_9ACTN|nr:ABC transporter substrate-binding protein [Nocardioides mangrovi]MBZ5739550.1 ABC transporter substrate-binding protein [Nocardioides mangrovi]
MQFGILSGRRAAALAGILALSVSSLAACGGDDSSAATTSDGLTKLTLLRSTGGTFEAIYIAQEQGFFKDAGLDVTIKAGAADTSQNVPSVLKGEAQLAMTDIGGLVKAGAEGLDVKAVAQIQASSDDIAQSDGLLVAKNSSISSPADLEGKKVGLPVLGGNLQMVAMYSVEEAGGDPSKVDWVALPTDSLQDAVNKGQVDAISTFATFYTTAVADGLKPIDKGGQELLGDPQSLIFADSGWLDDNADVAQEFVDAFSKGVDYANKNPDAVRAVDTKYTEMDADTIANRDISPFDYSFDTEAVDTAAANFYKYGITDNDVKGTDLLWSDAPTD